MRPERRIKPGVDGGLRAASWSAHMRPGFDGPWRRGRTQLVSGKNRAGCSQREADLPLLRLRRCDDRPIEGVPVSNEHNLFDTPCQGRVNERAIQ